MKTRYEFEMEFQELMDAALNELSPAQFKRLKEDVTMILQDYEE